MPLKLQKIVALWYIGSWRAPCEPHTSPDTSAHLQPLLNTLGRAVEQLALPSGAGGKSAVKVQVLQRRVNECLSQSLLQMRLPSLLCTGLQEFCAGSLIS